MNLLNQHQLFLRARAHVGFAYISRIVHVRRTRSECTYAHMVLCGQIKVIGGNKVGRLEPPRLRTALPMIVTQSVQPDGYTPMIATQATLLA